MVNMHQLAARDPALAALVGAIPGHDFGQDAGPPPGYGPQPDFQAGFGFSPFDPYAHSIGFGNIYGFGAPPHGPAGAPHPHPHMVHHPHHHPVHHDPTSTYSRSMLLDPNRNSTVKVERYSFSFSPSAALVLGTASAIASFTAQPSTSIKGQRLVTNAPSPGFVTLSSLQIANVNVFVGTTEDAFTYSAIAQGVMLDLPRLDPQNRATAAGNYTGVLPPGFTAGASFTFVITLQGPSTLAGGYGQ